MYNLTAMLDKTDTPRMEGLSGDSKPIRSAVAQGDPAAFERLVEPHAKHIYRISLGFCGNPEDASDLAQEVLVKAFRNIGSFRAESSVMTWLYRIAKNVFLDWKRAERARVQSVSVPIEKTKPISGDTHDPDRELAMLDSRDRIAHAMARLDPDQRAAVLFVDMEGLSYKETADILGVAIGTVKSRVSRAHDALRRILARQGGVKEAGR